MIKDLLPRQVVCNEKIEEKNKVQPCHGSLKRYHPLGDYYNETDEVLRKEIEQEYGENPKLVLLKCETCNVVYRLPKVLEEKFALA